MKILRRAFLALALITGIAAFFLFTGDLPASEVDAKYTSPASRFLELPSGMRIHYRDEGPRDAAAVVLIHGAMASLHTWEPWVEILSAEYRVVTLDLPGHGLTGRVPEAANGTNAFSNTIAAVTEALRLEQFVLGGNSMGGGATWRYALDNPEQVRAMLLVNSVAPRSWRRARAGEEPASGALAFRLLGQGWFRAIARYLDPRWLIERGLRTAYNNAPVVDDQLVDRYHELILREGTRAAILERTRGMGAPQPEPDLSSLSQPTLVIWGRHDALIPVAVADQFAARLANAEVIVYEDLGHVPMEEDPARTAADVLAFLRSLNLEPGRAAD